MYSYIHICYVQNRKFVSDGFGVGCGVGTDWIEWTRHTHKDNSNRQRGRCTNLVRRRMLYV